MDALLSGKFRYDVLPCKIMQLLLYPQSSVNTSELLSLLDALFNFFLF